MQRRQERHWRYPKIASYEEGRGVAKDPLEAERWRQAAGTNIEQGRAPAEFNVGTAYCLGEGIGKYLPKAVGWYRAAAQQGDVAAQFNLDWVYKKRHGNKDLPKGVHWDRAAAAQGNAQAQAYLGWAYAMGAGVTKDICEAYIWFSVAAADGDEAATETLDVINWRDHMTSAEIKSAQREANERMETIEQHAKDRNKPRLH